MRFVPKATFRVMELSELLCRHPDAVSHHCPEKRNAKGHGYQLLRRHTKAVTKILLFGRVFIGKACMKNPVRTGYAVL